MDVRKLLIGLLGAALVGVPFGACSVAPPVDARARIEAVEAEGQALFHAADSLEARLLAGKSALAHWEEMARRHREVSALSCRVTEGHLLEMRRGPSTSRLNVGKPERSRVLAKASEASPVSIQ